MERFVVICGEDLGWNCIGICFALRVLAATRAYLVRLGGEAQT